MAKLRRQAELQEKEVREQEELARKNVHRPGQKLDLNDFNKQYAEKMELMSTQLSEQGGKQSNIEETLTTQIDG